MREKSQVNICAIYRKENIFTEAERAWIRFGHDCLIINMILRLHETMNESQKYMAYFITFYI